LQLTALIDRGHTVLMAAIIYETGFPIDEFMSAVAEALRADGLRLCGAIQRNAGNRSCPDMSLVDIATGERVGISQELGSRARGCRLDPRGFAAATALLDTTMTDDFDLLVVNKFGKTEAEGAGLRDAFAHAVGAGIPVLMAVRKPYTEAWFAFHGGFAAALAPTLDAVLAWCRGAVRESRTT